MTFQLQMGRVKWFDVKRAMDLSLLSMAVKISMLIVELLRTPKISGLKKASVLNFQLRVTLMVLLLLMLSLMNFKPSSAANLSKKLTNTYQGRD